MSTRSFRFRSTQPQEVTHWILSYSTRMRPVQTAISKISISITNSEIFLQTAQALLEDPVRSGIFQVIETPTISLPTEWFIPSMCMLMRGLHERQISTFRRVFQK